MTTRELQALETMEQVVAHLVLRIRDRDVAIERLIDSIEADHRKLLAWMLMRDRAGCCECRPSTLDDRLRGGMCDLEARARLTHGD